ncbi:MAG: dihydrolipoamide acetyltransferase family protein [Chloroflexi bacterium]|nr:dihydrolipoamide acetyltransferase family protein [Chloroflexota bacterium]
MAYEITLPRLGWDMVEGALAGWLKAEGDWVNAGDLLFNVEGDKAVQEIEALDSGFLRILPNIPPQGEKIAVGTVLGFLVPKEEMAGFRFPQDDSPALTENAPAETAPVVVSEILETNLVTESDIQTRVYISPYAKRLAEDLGVDWHKLAGSGLRGRIMAKDVQKIVAQQKPASPATNLTAPVSAARPVSFPRSAPIAPGVESRSSMSTARRKTAEHLSHSVHTVAPVTLTTEVDATEMVRLRSTLKLQDGGLGLLVPSYTDILAKICAQALMDFPMLNARLEGDEIVQFLSAHIALAVDTERGLLTPILRDVQAKSLRQVARESSLLIEKARVGQIGYDDLQGATFTITNLGMFEIDSFTPIIDLPQCAILGVGRIVARQVVLDFEKEILALRQCATLSLTFDHRLNDGAGAARFLQRIKRYIENPYLWLAGI